MRYIVTISLLFIYSCVSAQKTNEGVRKVVAAFNTALENKDTIALKNILNDNLSYGHSNAWVETKGEVITNLYNGKIVYNKISQPALLVSIKGDIATVRGNGIFDVMFNEKQISFDLHVLQTWIWEKGRWQLLNRQSTQNN